MPALATWTPEDGLLAAIAPLGLAAAAGTALVVDLDRHGPRYPGRESLAELVHRSPRRTDLTPSRAGLAVLSNGGIDLPDAREVVEALVAGWPAVVLRLPAGGRDHAMAPVVPVRPLLPGALAPPADSGPAVYQRTGFAVAPPGPWPVLPVPRSRTVAALLTGIVPAVDRWLGAWRMVWRLPWA